MTRDRLSSFDFRSRLLRRSTGNMGGFISPDGRLIDLWSRPAESPRFVAAIVPFEGGEERAVQPPAGNIVHAEWDWSSSTVLYLVRGSGGKGILHRFDLATGRTRVLGDFPERGVPSRLGPDMLAWINDSAYAVVLADTNGKVLRRLPDPDRTERYGLTMSSPDARRLVTMRWSAGYDSLLFTMVDTESGARRRVGGLRVEEPSFFYWAPDGSMQIGVLETWGTQAFYRLDPATARMTGWRRPRRRVCCSTRSRGMDSAASRRRADHGAMCG